MNEKLKMSMVIFLSYMTINFMLINDLESQQMNNMEQVQRLIREKKTSEAIESLKNIMDKEPGNIDAHRIFIDLMNSEGRGDEVETLYRKKVEKQPDSAAFHYLYGRAIFSKIEEAEKEFQTAISHDPEFVWGYLGLGHLYVVKNDFFSAVNIYEEGLKRIPDSYELTYNLANIYYDLRVLRKSKEYFERCIHIDSERPEAWAGLARLYLLENNLEEAEKKVSASLDISPHFPLAIQVKIEILLGKGNGEEASNLLEESQKLGIDFSEEFIKYVRDSVEELNKKRLNPIKKEKKKKGMWGCSCN